MASPLTARFLEALIGAAAAGGVGAGIGAAAAPKDGPLFYTDPRTGEVRQRERSPEEAQARRGAMAAGALLGAVLGGAAAPAASSMMLTRALARDADSLTAAVKPMWDTFGRAHDAEATAGAAIARRLAGREKVRALARTATNRKQLDVLGRELEGQIGDAYNAARKSFSERPFASLFGEAGGTAAAKAKAKTFLSSIHKSHPASGNSNEAALIFEAIKRAQDAAQANRQAEILGAVTHAAQDANEVLRAARVATAKAAATP